MTSRIQHILKSKHLSPSQFADQIQVQRSSVSHILSGRNKPSLDFVMKVLSSYPDVDAEWLLFGKGKMEKGKETQHPLPEATLPLARSEERIPYGTEKEIEKIVLLYKDGSFKSFSS